MNRSTVDIPFLLEVLSEERIWEILKVANLMRKVWWLQQEEKEKKEKKLIWRFAYSMFPIKRIVFLCTERLVKNTVRLIGSIE